MPIKVSRDRLTPEERLALVRRAQSGDLNARNLLVTHNVPLVLQFIRRLLPMASDSLKDDLIQEGVLGLMEAVDRFDPARGSWSTCATWGVRARVLHWLHIQNSITQGGGYERTDIDTEIPNDSVDQGPSPEFAYACAESDLVVRAAAHAAATCTRGRQSKKLLAHAIVDRRWLTDNPETLDAIGRTHRVSREMVRRTEMLVSDRLRESLS